MKNLLIIFISLMFVYSTNIKAQSSSDTVDSKVSIHYNFEDMETNSIQVSTGPFKHSIGAGLGHTTGHGISYRYKPKKFGIQANFAPYITRNINKYSTGLTFLYTVIESNISNLFLYQGNHFFYEAFLGRNREKSGRQFYINNGFGFGIEVIAIKRISFNIMAGYAAYKSLRELKVTGETGMYYKF